MHISFDYVCYCYFSCLLDYCRDMSSDVSSFTLSEADVLLESGEAILVQLTVTPKVEGILKIVGVRWKLSGSVVGLYNFETNVVKKRIAKGRRGAKSSPSNDLKFLVIESLPKLEGFIRHIPERAYAGDLRHLVLELRNPSEFSVKNLKIKVSHPRFLCVGKQDELMKEFPACLEKKTVAEQSGALGNSSKRPHALFLFPEDITVQGNTPLLWPLWFRAAVPGNISLLITIYYEMGNMSSVIKYRTLRMRYNMQVLPSLNVAYQISPCPSRLRQFLVRMDILNQTSSESFQVHQLSAVGHQWEISLLQPFDVIFPSKSLFTGQALSCFFILKNHGKSLTSKDKSSSLSIPLLGSDVNLQASNDRLFDISSSPLADFHCCERSQGVSSQDDPNTVDFILISWLPKTDGVSDSRLFSHHACHCRQGFDTVASVRVNTFDFSSSSGQSSGATTTQASVPSGNQSGWHEVRALTEIKVTSSIPRNEVGKSPSLGSVSPYIWSGSSATSVRLEPKSTAEILLEICVFSPGTYDLSNYSLNWNLLGVNDQGNEEEGTKQSSGTCYGYPYFFTVLESA
ncbi:hypothetical protein Patl1_32733 [Pistacia atlantica]|uniref:Uncharacterized protein n=1 Tax=Pistacia atlantica TaxID=434234 RepID=A0ACC1AQ73_9ROSI|nr:hypothetical protein Patl1_32733 [Pistacia atlantica]